MDGEVLRMLAHIDQTRSELRETLAGIPTAQIAALIKTCAAARFDELDEKHRLLVGLLAVACIFDLRLNTSDD